ncbi:hypothetical protein OAK75_13505 [Bacteriovoracales bacterium]|nr:hypothetical protein [Bacteriovoracales bacterium]
MFNFKVVVSLLAFFTCFSFLEASSGCRRLLKEGKRSIKKCSRLKNTSAKIKCADRVQKRLERKIKRRKGKNKCPRLIDKVGNYAEKIGR